MSRRAAAFTQADVARAIRAAKAEGCQTVRIVYTSGAAIEVLTTDEKRDVLADLRKKRPVL